MPGTREKDLAIVTHDKQISVEQLEWSTEWISFTFAGSRIFIPAAAPILARRVGRRFAVLTSVLNRAGDQGDDIMVGIH